MIPSYEFFVTNLYYFFLFLTVHFIKFEFKHIYVVSLLNKVNYLPIKLKVKNITYSFISILRYFY